MEYYKNLKSQLFIKKTRIKNRTVMSPMGTNLAESDGSIGDKLISYYEERAKGGVGLIIPGVISVDYPRGKTISNQIRLDHMKYTKGVQNLAEAIHRYDSKLILQIHHAGAQTHKGVTDGVTPLSASEGEDQSGNPCEVMTEEVISEIISKFVQTAVLAEMAGADGVEIHGAHGYLISQFLSPVLNKRTDAYGGSEENRRRLLLEIIRAIKASVNPNFIVGARIGSRDLYPEGYDLEEGKRIIKAAEEEGLDYVNLSFGAFEQQSLSAMIETQKFEDGNRINDARYIKESIDIPVIQAGKLRTPDMCESYLERGYLDMVSMGRTFIADPQWMNKVNSNKSHEIKKCLSCNDGCIGKLFPSGEIRCAINPLVGKEYQFKAFKDADVKRHVLIVGGGPAGSQAAITASRKGHRVTLLEETSSIGGQLLLAATPPHKEVIGDYIEWLDGELKRQNVNVIKNSRAGLEVIRAMKPEVVLVATGSKPVKAPIKGVEKTISSWEVLDKYSTLPQDKNIAIIGGGIVGCETAHLLAEHNNKITILEMQGQIARGLESSNLLDLHMSFKALGVEAKTSSKVLDLRDQGVSFEDSEGKKGFVDADMVITSIGQVSNRQDLVEHIIEELGVDARYIGDAKEVGKIVDAVQNGFYAAWDI